MTIISSKSLFSYFVSFRYAPKKILRKFIQRFLLEFSQEPVKHFPRVSNSKFWKKNIFRYLLLWVYFQCILREIPVNCDTVLEEFLKGSLVELQEKTIDEIRKKKFWKSRRESPEETPAETTVGVLICNASKCTFREFLPTFWRNF